MKDNDFESQEQFSLGVWTDSSKSALFLNNWTETELGEFGAPPSGEWMYDIFDTISSFIMGCTVFKKREMRAYRIVYINLCWRLKLWNKEVCNKVQ